MATLALEIQHRIDHVFKHAGAGNGAFLGDMADQDQREAPALGQADQLLGRGPHLGHRAGGRFQGIDEHGLDAVDDDQVRAAGGVQGGHDVAHVGRRRQLHGSIGQAQAPGAQAKLFDRFLARDIGRRVVGGQFGRDLHEKGRFADPRIAADQHGGALHQPAAGNPVELFHLGGPARRLGVFTLQADEFDPAALAPGAQALGRGVALGFLDQGIPGVAAVALARPPVMDGAAFLTDVLARRALGQWNLAFPG